MKKKGKEELKISAKKRKKKVEIIVRKKKSREFVVLTTLTIVIAVSIIFLLSTSYFSATGNVPLSFSKNAAAEPPLALDTNPPISCQGQNIDIMSPNEFTEYAYEKYKKPFLILAKEKCLTASPQSYDTFITVEFNTGQVETVRDPNDWNYIRYVHLWRTDDNLAAVNRFRSKCWIIERHDDNGDGEIERSERKDIPSGDLVGGNFDKEICIDGKGDAWEFAIGDKLNKYVLGSFGLESEIGHKWVIKFSFAQTAVNYMGNLAENIYEYLKDLCNLKFCSVFIFET